MYWKLSRVKTVFRCLGVMMIAVSCFTSGCHKHMDHERDGLTLKDIAYSNDRENYTVYLKENDTYAPYIVISDDYGGGVLVVRKYLFPSQTYFNAQKSHGSVGGYYPNSHVDMYLNHEFLSGLSPATQEAILQTSLEVSTVNTVLSGGFVHETETVSRKVFLLSATEMNIKSGMTSPEGEPLSYFKGRKNFVAVTEDGTADAYWLRSAYLWDDIQAWAIGADGKYGGSSVSVEYSVRPAFCLEKDTPIILNRDVFPDIAVYTIEKGGIIS